MYIIHALNGLLMIAIPICLAIFCNSKLRKSWRFWWIGGTVFILSQVGHIPFNYLSGLVLNKTSLVMWPKTYQLIFNAVFLGLSAGLWEEGARYGMYRWWVKKSRNWSDGVCLGIGHGGFESAILGILALYSFIQLATIKNLDISTLVPNDQLASTILSIKQYWAMPWYDSMLGSVERILTLPIQICISVLVLQAFTRKKIRWLWIAILFHAVIDATAVLFISLSNVYITELVVAIFSIVCIGLIFVLRQPEQVEFVGESQISAIPVQIKEVDESIENLNGTKFQ
jgi:uncharacterized membrane protein YhfC